MDTKGLLIWDFDGTLGYRAGAWTGAIVDVVKEAMPASTVSRDDIRPHLQAGFPWHAPEVDRPRRGPGEWWDDLAPVLLGALRSGAGLSEVEATTLVPRIRDAFTDMSSWRLFDDSLPVRTDLRRRGWRHVVLSNHVPELEEILQTLGVRQQLDAVFCSACTGIEKPRPEAFAAVLADHPGHARVVVIGDILGADIRGADGVGLDSILVRQTHAEARIQCQTLYDVAGVLDAM